MLIVIAVVFLWLRPRETKRLWPLVLPALVLVHFALPGTIGGLKASFFPEGGLVANQSQSVGSRGQGRVADLGPAIREWSQNPLLGQGYGSRVVDGENPNAQILDNQWLGSLLETGLLGVFAIAWLFWRAVRRLGRAAKRNPTPEGSLFVAIAASIAAFAVGMLTFDAFAFIQVTFFLFILLACAAAALVIEERVGWGHDAGSRRPRPVRGKRPPTRLEARLG
jgi:O-antigen ligase